MNPLSVHERRRRPHPELPRLAPQVRPAGQADHRGEGGQRQAPSLRGRIRSTLAGAETREDAGKLAQAEAARRRALPGVSPRV